MVRPVFYASSNSWALCETEGNVARVLNENELAKFCAEHQALLEAKKTASQLLYDIMVGICNHEDEAEKWLRAYAPEALD